MNRAAASFACGAVAMVALSAVLPPIAPPWFPPTGDSGRGSKSSPKADPPGGFNQPINKDSGPLAGFAKQGVIALPGSSNAAARPPEPARFRPGYGRKAIKEPEVVNVIELEEKKVVK